MKLLARMRSALLAGLFVVIPLAVTTWVLWTLVDFLDRLGVRFVPEPLQPRNLVGQDVPGVGVVLTITLVLLIGIGAQNYLGRRFISLYELVLSRVPILSSLYQGVKQITESLFRSDSEAFKRVVLVQWPRPGVYSIAFSTGEAWVSEEGGERRLLNVFLPSTPNPTTGFYFIVPEEEVVMTTLTVEQAAKLLVSAGIVSPESGFSVPQLPTIPDSDG